MVYLFDGAMGTMLQQAGLLAGDCPELWNLSKPEIVREIHRAYVLSGADVIETNTFGANRLKLSEYGLADKVSLINTAAVAAVRKAAGRYIKIAGSVGPTGKFIAPLGNVSFDAAYAVFFEQITALDEAGVDFILIETMTDIQEVRAALLAAKAASKKPVICQMSFGEDGRTVTGTDPRTAAIVLAAMGADIVGANCSLGPAHLIEVVETMAAAVNCPVIVQPNAGMPELVNGKTVFPLSPQDMALSAIRLVEAGASYIGGCCGTTPAHIKAMREVLDGSAVDSRVAQNKQLTALTSRSQTIYLGREFPAVIIGERINPTGRKALASDIRNGQLGLVKKEAIRQVAAGAAILDVNVGVPGIDEPAVMGKIVEELSMLVDTPLAIDTTDAAALEAGLKAFPGRALVNSVSNEPQRLATYLPLAKKYGAAIICLPLSPGGLPATATERVREIRQIIEAAQAAGLKEHDFLLDALVLTIATNAQAATAVLDTLNQYRQQFGYPTVMGLSNISYGLPRRDVINAAFCSLALAAGLDAPILNPYDSLCKDSIAAAKALLGQDACAVKFSQSLAALNSQSINSSTTTEQAPTDVVTQVRRAVIQGEKEAITPLVRQALAEGYSAAEVIDQGLTVAMNEIGDAFRTGRCFLPQVMLAAETMRIAFAVIKEILPADKVASRGTVVLATVKGDIHDLGKNIVAALLENSGFKVIDLGKDVAAVKIVAAAKAAKADIVGLCALMTTTMPQIDETIAALSAAGSTAYTMVGGAVVTADYAAKAGATAYAVDGVDAVTQAKRLLKEKAHV